MTTQIQIEGHSTKQLACTLQIYQYNANKKLESFYGLKVTKGT